MGFKEDLQKIAGEDFERIWASFWTPKQTGFFVNSLLASAEEIERELSNLNIKFESVLPNFYLTDSGAKAVLSRSELFNSGKIYIQNVSSYLAPLNLGASEGMSVLDMCASPGGKTIALANFMASESNLNPNLAAMEANKDRFFTLKSNLKKYGCEFARTYNKDARSIAKTCEGRFDRILLDAPCSGYAGYCEGFPEKSHKEIKAIAKLQKGLLNAALTALKDGGEMIYSTCTFYAEENEEVVANALNSKFEIELLPLSFTLPECQSGELGARVVPSGRADGFYLAKIKKIRRL